MAGKNPFYTDKIVLRSGVGGGIYLDDGTTIIDQNGNIDAPITTTNLTTSGNTTLGDAAGDANTFVGTNQFNNTITVGVNDTGYDVTFFGATSGKKFLWDESADTAFLTCTVDIDGTVTVGVDDTGYDVKFFGATAGKYWLWDESADKVISVGDYDITGNSQFTGTIIVGVDDTGHDVKFFGATSGKSFLWDESADKLIVTGDASVSGTFTIVAGGSIASSVATFLAPFYCNAAQDNIAEGAGGAISVATPYTTIGADAGGDAFTLASGQVIGQVKKIYLKSTSGGTGVVTGAFRGAYNTLTFTNAGEYAILQWDGTDWLDIELASGLSATQAPALSTV